MHGDTVPRRPRPAPESHERVVLDRLGHDQVPTGTQHPLRLGQHLGGLLEVVENVDAPHQVDARGGDGEPLAVGHGSRRLASGLGGPVGFVLDADGP